MNGCGGSAVVKEALCDCFSWGNYCDWKKAFILNKKGNNSVSMKVKLERECLPQLRHRKITNLQNRFKLYVLHISFYVIPIILSGLSEIAEVSQNIIINTFFSNIRVMLDHFISQHTFMNTELTYMR